MDFKVKMNELNAKINDFFNFVIGNLKNYKNLSLGEQISYPLIGVGFILVITSIVMFIV